MSIPIHSLALLALVQLPQADSVARPQLDSAWCAALTAERPGTAVADTVPVWVLVDRWGRVDSARVDSSASITEVRAAILLRSARELRFLPWDEGPGWARVECPVRLPRSAVFTPYTRVPRVKNPGGARRIVERYHPEELRHLGVGGEVTTWVFVDTTGVVKNALIQSSSGNRELDEAAERAVYEIEFTPALNRGRRVPVWVAFPIVFEGTPARASQPPPREFVLGPGYGPVAEATLESPGELEALPELICPDETRERLSRLYLDSDPAEDLGLVVTLQVGADGVVQTRRITERLGGATRYESAVTAIYSELGRLRFRPGVVSGEPTRTSFSVRLVFSPDIGLAPSPRLSRTSPMPLFDSSGCAGADSVLTSGPQLSPRDEDPQLVTPEWEQARLISDTWPIALQRRHESYEFRFWLLLDDSGRVCEAEWLNELEDRWVAAKARHIVRRFRFKPASLDGRPVAAWYEFALAFSFVRE
jgi:TonB family protein